MSLLQYSKWFDDKMLKIIRNELRYDQTWAVVNYKKVIKLPTYLTTLVGKVVVVNYFPKRVTAEYKSYHIWVQVV